MGCEKLTKFAQYKQQLRQVLRFDEKIFDLISTSYDKDIRLAPDLLRKENSGGNADGKGQK